MNRHADEKVGEINPFLIRSCFHLNNKEYGVALRFSSSHLKQLWQLRKRASECVELNWLQLVVAYATVNAERVRQWIDFDRQASALIISGEPTKVAEKLLSLTPIDQQSAYSMRLYASLHAYSDDVIKSYLNTNLTSNWVKGRLLYPLIFYAINQPAPIALTQMLEHLMPTGEDSSSERALIRFLLSPQDDLDASLSYRCYVGLMGHPYDALEYVTQHLESLLARNMDVGGDILKLVDQLAEAFPEHRIARLLRLLSGGRLSVLETAPQLFHLEGGAVSEEIIQLLDARRTEPDIKSDYPLLDAFRSLRWNLYPVAADYDVIGVYRYRFAMLSAGTFVNWLARSLFLFERDSYQLEALWLLRGCLMCDGLLPLLMMGPHGPPAIESWSNSIAPGASTVRPFVEATFGAGKQRTDRLWISVSNWSIAHLQRQGKLQEWAAEARHTFPVWLEPRYLSGLDWRWLTNVVDQVGIMPFRGEPSGIYVLFLRLLEERLHEYTALRLALEPRVVRGEPEKLFEWFTKEFGRDGLAMVRTILIPETILKLRLADNYTAALTARLSLLEAGVKRFNFIEGVLSEDDLNREALALTASLSRMSLGARQFELPWDTLQTDAVLRNQATYDAYSTMLSAVGDSSAVTNAKRVSTYPFSNGAIGEYEGRNREWPLILTIAGVVDTFLSHPTGGIEAILSVRIRHDAFRRELVNAIQEVQTAPIIGVRRSTKTQFVDAATAALSREINGWLDARMHTLRKSKEAALFDFVPTRAEMAELVAASMSATTLEGVVRLVLDWVKPRLDVQLERARVALITDLAARLKAKLHQTKALVAQNADRQADVDKIAANATAVVERRLMSLIEWFRIPEAARDQTLTLREIYLAVQARFLTTGKLTNIVFGPLPPAYVGKILQPAHIRQMYDLLSEIVQNAIKHGGRDRIRIRFRQAKKTTSRC
ncbi:hypothetical protein NKH63_19975 [Mesorhizobium sp. M0960]|uniref:hypothetical protein n=1 Tax=Mesorhizobium sp. M0960 TaxID=2957035 RepID=UPI00333C058A